METKPTVVILSAFYDPWMSGAERCVKEVVERLGSRYHFVVLTGKYKSSLPRKELRDGFEIHRIGLGSKFDKWLYPVLVPLYLLRLQPKVVHAVMESYAGIALWLTSFVMPRLPRILTLQSGDLDSTEKRRKIPEWLWRAIHRSPDSVTAISNFLADRAKRLRGSTKNIFIIPNGISLSSISSDASSQKIPHKIVCVARLSWEKGHATLLDALKEVRKTVEDVTLDLVGDGNLRSELEAKVKELGLEDVVTFHGLLPNEKALDVLRCAEVFVCPSLAEGLGIVFLEAQACGVPVIGTNVGGIPDVIADGVTGLLVSPKDAHALASAVCRLFTDTDLAARCRTAGLEQAKKFDWTEIVQKYAKEYDRLIGEKRLLIATGIYPPAIGGPATYVKAVTPALIKKGAEVKVLTYGDKDTLQPSEYVLTRVSSTLPTCIRHLVYFWQTFVLGRQSDVIFLLDTVSVGLPGMLAAKLLGKKTVVRVVGDYAWEQGQNRFGVTDALDDFQMRQYSLVVEFLRNVQRFVVRSADVVIVPSTYLSGIVEKWGVSSSRIQVIANAVTVPVPATHLPLGERPMKIVTAGRLVSWKGIREFVRVMPEIQKQIGDATLTIVGDGPLHDTIASEIMRLNLQTSVQMIGRLSHEKLVEEIASARLFVLYSGYEGFSHQLVEVMGIGTPVVCSSAGGNADVAVDGKNARVVTFGDEPVLVSSVVAVLKDTEVSERLCAEAKHTAGEYTVERMVEKAWEMLITLV